MTAGDAQAVEACQVSQRTEETRARPLCHCDDAKDFEPAGFVVGDLTERRRTGVCARLNVMPAGRSGSGNRHPSEFVTVYIGSMRIAVMEYGSKCLMVAITGAPSNGRGKP